MVLVVDVVLDFGLLVLLTLCLFDWFTLLFVVMQLACLVGVFVSLIFGSLLVMVVFIVSFGCCGYILWCVFRANDCWLLYCWLLLAVFCLFGLFDFDYYVMVVEFGGCLRVVFC